MRASRANEADLRRTSRRSGAWIVFALLLTGCIIYMIAATEVGKFISDKVFVPVVAWISGEKKGTETPGPSDSETPSSNLSTIGFKLDKFDAYALQAGAFSEEANANAMSGELKSKGGAGYIYYDGEVYRVFIAAYVNQSDAENVKARLLAEQNMESKIYTVSSDMVDMDISVSEADAIYVESAMEVIADQQAEIISAALEFDKGALTSDQAIAKLNEIKTAAKTFMDRFSNSTNDSILAIRAYSKSVYDNIGELLQSDLTSVELSAEIKHFYMELLFERQQLCKALNA